MPGGATSDGDDRGRGARREDQRLTLTLYSFTIYHPTCPVGHRLRLLSPSPSQAIDHRAWTLRVNPRFFAAPPPRVGSESNVVAGVSPLLALKPRGAFESLGMDGSMVKEM